MPSQKDVKSIDREGKVTKKRSFGRGDWNQVAEYIIDEWTTRKAARALRERHWADVDRQIAMEPELKYKKLANGQIDFTKKWMAEMELPLQAQALEVLTSDARRFMFSDEWFRAHAETTDAYLDKVDFSSLILGDEMEVPSQINQDNADKLVEGFLKHQFRQVDLFGRQDRINAEAFKYGMGVGRARMESKTIYIHESMGVRKETQSIPVLVPVSIKNLYLDTPLPSMHSAQVLGQSHIAEDNIRLVNLHLAANAGSTDPEDMDGGWMPKNLKDVEPEDNGYVRVLEFEGDLVVPRKSTRSFVIPGAIATVVVGAKAKAGNVTTAVIRFRFRQAPYSSYLLYPYHYEGVDDIYPTSPLEKGRPVQIMATDAVNNMMDSAALKNRPPVGYDKNDPAFARTGGPVIEPGATWPTTEEVRVYNTVGGDQAGMQNAVSLGINLHSELTGVLPSRIGAQTVSHTTAFAKDAELQRGAVRTIDFVNQSGHGPLTRWLYMAYDMGRDAIKSNESVSFFIDSYGGFVEVKKAHLPERASFEWFGNGGPQQEAQKDQRRVQALQIAIQMDQLSVQMGNQPTLDIPSAIKQTLRGGGWTDIDTITSDEQTKQLPDPNPGSAVVAQQVLPGLVKGQ